ncbi:hypothetical protein [Shewanella sp. 10N.286.48.B5]|uniref:hypothetical protein n=1 Tax=Shewanella sp. 10N.286.48.B5 TaxID=1880834 RepID=UPI000C85F326|nr:hypothetical protein [Shewanella sp. 10N.286.48.B5]PMH85894.1 hypothetical protein BCU57_12720 [Shewanella sp. 10N.286.48.B5]
MTSLGDEKILARIQQLIEQFNMVKIRDLVIVFGPIGKKASYSYWSCDENYRGNGFFYLMQHLLEVFIEYRGTFNLTQLNHGIIKIECRTASIEWVNEIDAENKIVKLKGEESENIR